MAGEEEGGFCSQGACATGRSGEREEASGGVKDMTTAERAERRRRERGAASLHWRSYTHILTRTHAS